MAVEEQAVEHVDVLIIGGGPVGSYSPRSLTPSLQYRPRSTHPPVPHV